MEEELLKEIAKNTSSKQSFQFIVSSNKTSFITSFSPPLQLESDKHYEIALVNLETYYSFPNVHKENNLSIPKIMGKHGKKYLFLKALMKF